MTVKSLRSLMIQPSGDTSIEFNREMDEFFKSLEDGTVFVSISDEVWELADKLVRQFPGISDGL